MSSSPLVKYNTKESESERQLYVKWERAVDTAEYATTHEQVSSGPGVPMVKVI